jgi:nucleoside-diphosphate-sugar epimerase
MHRGAVFVGCDNVPVTMEEMIAACKEHGPFQGNVRFTGTEETVGKVIGSEASNAALGWKPKYDGFVHFMKSTGGKDWYSASTATAAG